LLNSGAVTTIYFAWEVRFSAFLMATIPFCIGPPPSSPPLHVAASPFPYVSIVRGNFPSRMGISAGEVLHWVTRA
jgi:hypothetical protein